MKERRRIVWTEAALRDHESIIHFVAERDGIGHAERLHAKLHPAIGALAASPTRCRVVPELRAIGVVSYREPVVRPYRVPFRIDGRDVFIMAVLDARRDLEELLLDRLLEG